MSGPVELHVPVPLEGYVPPTIDGGVIYPVSRAPRPPDAGPWETIGEPMPWCRCGHAAEDHTAWRCELRPCSCRELVCVGVMRVQQRRVIEYDGPAQ